MNRADHILEQLQQELGFEPELLGGRPVVLAQIERFLTAHKVEPDTNLVADPLLWAKLISEVVIPETSFFRYPESFKALADWATKSSRQCPQILCLPCSTGEEAYSISIALHEVGRQSFRVTACDASARSVAHAERGHYGTRALTGLAAIGRGEWLREGSVRDEIRKPVTFQVANAFTFAATPKSFDVIFCRNLLIYFDAQNQHRLFALLDTWLMPGGVLFLGPGEATIASSHGWKSTGHSMSFSFTRGNQPGPPPTSRKPARPVTALPKRPAPAAKPLPPKPAQTPPPREEIPTLTHAMELADAGLLEDAAATLARFHARESPTAQSLLLRGILEEAATEFSSAEQSYRQALYLNPDELDALLHLARRLEADGRPQAAAPLRRRIERLAQPS